MPDPVYVDYEYGDLKELIVGRGVMLYPNVEHAAWVAEFVKVLPEVEAKRAWERSGKDSRDRDQG